MSSGQYYGQQPQYPPQSYGPPPGQYQQQGGYYPPQGQMQYGQQQPPPQQQAAYKQKSQSHGCLGSCLAVLCCCFVCEEGCECLEGCC